MKSLFAAIIILISFTVNAQTRYVNTSSKDTVKVTDSTMFYLTINDLKRYLDVLKDKVSSRQWDYIVLGVNLMLTEMTNEKKYIKPK